MVNGGARSTVAGTHAVQLGTATIIGALHMGVVCKHGSAPPQDGINTDMGGPQIEGTHESAFPGQQAGQQLDMFGRPAYVPTPYPPPEGVVFERPHPAAEDACP